jgi:hypothetical protein
MHKPLRVTRYLLRVASYRLKVGLAIELPMLQLASLKPLRSEFRILNSGFWVLMIWSPV